MQLIAEGRTAQVFSLGDGRVVKLDRPEWHGLSTFESDVITRAAGAGLPVARSFGVVTIDGRSGVILERVEGSSLTEVVQGATDAEVRDLADRFADLQSMVNATSIDGLPDLVERLHAELSLSDLPTPLVGELDELLRALDDGHRGVCHFDFHPGNVLVSPEGWIVIDWLTAASGPPVADLARTLLLRGDVRHSPMVDFIRRVRRHSVERRSLEGATCDGWIRIAAAARMAEGFSGEYAAWLGKVAAGAIRLGE
jgi:aminoglycoside phosphotransferase (APT) family kinase protein